MHIRSFLAGVALVAATALSANAAVIGTVSTSVFGVSSNTGNLRGTTFTSAAELVSGFSGYFTGKVSEFQILGTGSFSTTGTGNLTLSGAGFGLFQSTTVRKTSSTATSVTYNLLGDWSAAGNFEPASLTIALTQNGGGAISESASFSVPPVPELSTWGMMLVGFGALAFAGYRRRAIAA